jgi:RND family efflux transporter MFP subunit
MKKWLTWALALTLLFSLTACGGEEAPVEEEEEGSSGVAVQVQAVVSDTIYAEQTVSGKLETEDEATVMVAANAKCTATYVETGDMVRAGQALCKLDLTSTQTSYEAASISYAASLQSYQDQEAVFAKQIALYEKNLQDLQELKEIGAAAQIEIDQAELQLQSTIATRNSTLSQLEAGMQNTKANMEQLETVLDNVDASGNVISPASGTLIQFSAVEGGFVSTAAPVAVIDAVDQLKITVSVSEALVPKLTVGAEAEVTISAVGETFTAPIRNIDRSANPQTRLYNVTLSAPSSISGLLAGMFADVTFHTDFSENAVVVPTEAVMTSGGTQYVYVVEGETAKYIEVTTGLTSSGVTEVLTGLTAGQQLVTVGQSYLTDGALVRIVGGGASEAPAEAQPQEEGA